MSTTFHEFGIVYVKRGARGTCRGSGLRAAHTWTAGSAAPCPHCGRTLRVTYFLRLPTHKKRIRQR